MDAQERARRIAHTYTQEPRPSREEIVEFLASDLRQASLEARHAALEEATEIVHAIDIDGLEYTIGEQIRALKDKSSTLEP